jgi:hypothetical protein
MGGHDFVTQAESNRFRLDRLRERAIPRVGSAFPVVIDLPASMLLFTQQSAPPV